jgi:hypothetical protein
MPEPGVIDRFTALRVLVSAVAAGIVATSRRAAAADSENLRPEYCVPGHCGPQRIVQLDLGSFDAIEVVLRGESTLITSGAIWTALTGEVVWEPR